MSAALGGVLDAFGDRLELEHPADRDDGHCEHLFSAADPERVDEALVDLQDVDGGTA